ncbi:hypothetical protein DFJ73DRAFT_369412 [Zopfochytrium polystomum]|nr:hypothetical protein DFJ73DRAFT_369412 [Zopfochytrium polystomum]
MALLPSPQADSPASAHPLSSSISSSDPSALSLPSSCPTTDSAGGDRSGKSKLKTEKDKVPSAESAKKSKEISSTMRMPSAAKPSAMGKQRGQSAAGPASAASSSASASSAPNKKKPKKKNWLGISGYQRAGEEAPVSSSAVVEPMEVSSPPPSTQAASGAQRCEDTPATRESSVLSSRQASPERRPIAEGPDVAMTEAKLEPAAAEPGGHVDVKMEDVVLQTPANVEDPMLVKHWRRRCLPLYTIQLPVTQESSPSALAFAHKKSFMVDLQVALFMGLKSGREVLDRFPRLTTRVASLTEKLQLQASPLGEAVLESILDARGAGPGTLPPRYIRWYERRGKRALRLDALDIQFLDADEVVAVFREVVCSGAGDSGGGGGASGSDDGRLWALELREDEVASLDLQAFAEDGGDAAGSGTGGASAAASGSGTVANDGKIAVTPASTPPLLPAGLSAGPALPSASAVGGFAGPAAPSAATPCPSSASSTQAPSVFSTASSAAIVAAATTGVSLTSSAPAPASVPATSFLDPRKKAWRAMTAAAAASSSSSSSSAASMPLAANATSATPGTAPKTSPPSSSSSSSLLGATTAVPPAYPADPPAANAGGESAVAGPKAAAAVDYKYVHKLKRIPNG